MENNIKKCKKAPNSAQAPPQFASTLSTEKKENPTQFNFNDEILIKKKPNH
jgi:hypothetical protein